MTAKDDFWGAGSDEGAPDGNAPGTECAPLDLAPDAPRVVLMDLAHFAHFQAICNTPFMRLLAFVFQHLVAEGLLDRDALLAALAACRERRDALMTLDGVVACVSKGQGNAEAKNGRAKPPAWTPTVIDGDGVNGERHEHGAAKGGKRTRPALRSVANTSNNANKGEKA